MAAARPAKAKYYEL